MLDKIPNIAPGTDYKNSPYKKGKRDMLFSRTSATSEIHDSLSFSPAWMYVSNLSWQILSVKFVADEKVAIRFIISSIEFYTIIDLNDMNSSSKFVYDLQQKREFIGNKKSTLVTLEKNGFFLLQNSNNYDYRYINKLFDKIWNLNLKNELNDEEFYLNTLLEEFYNGAHSEMNFITYSLVTFVGKLLNKTLSQNFLKEENPSGILKIKKIKTFNA